MSARLLAPAATTATATCRTCGGRQEVETAATGFRCPLCGAEWRWAACGGCGRFHLLDAAVESWSCRRCHASTRSWWRTATARRDEHDVAARRSGELAERRRRETRHRRRSVLVGGAVALAAGLVVALTVVAAGPPGDPTRQTCVAYARLRPALFNGSVRGAELRTQVEELAQEGADADVEVASATRRLASAGAVGGRSFEEALVDVDDVCRRHPG